MKQFGVMESGECVAAFCKFLNDSQRVKDAGWFVGEDAMSNWIKEIRKLDEDRQKTKDDQAAKIEGNPNGVYVLVYRRKSC